jgi:hypothetical protein
MLLGCCHERLLERQNCGGMHCLHAQLHLHTCVLTASQCIHARKDMQAGLAGVIALPLGDIQHMRYARAASCRARGACCT